MRDLTSKKIKDFRSNLGDRFQSFALERDNEAKARKQLDAIPEEIVEGNEDVSIERLIDLEEMLGKHEIPIDETETTSTTLSKITNYEKSIEVQMEDVKFSFGEESLVSKTQLGRCIKAKTSLWLAILCMIYCISILSRLAP